MNQVKIMSPRTIWPWVLSAVIVATFARALSAEFVQWDDDINFYRNPHIQALGWEQLKWMFTDTKYVQYYAPLSWLAAALIHSVWGLNPFGYHLANVLLHAANTILVFRLSVMFLCLFGGSNDKVTDKVNDEVGGKVGAENVAGALAALLWGIHPLRVEPVAWATGLSNCLALFLCLLTALCYFNYLSSRSRRSYWAGVAAFGASLLCYPIGLALPAALLVVAIYISMFRQKEADMLKHELQPSGDTLQRGGGTAKRVAMRHIVELLPFFVASAVMLGFTVYRRMNVEGIWDAPASMETFEWDSRVMQAVYIWAYYLWKALLPFNLSPVYTTLVWFSPTDWPFLLSLAALVIVSTMVFWSWRRFPGLATVWLCYLIVLVPFQGWFEHPHFPSDRYSLLPHVVLTVGLGWLLARAWSRQRTRTAATAVALLIALLLVPLTVAQAGVWKNSEVLLNYILGQVSSSRYRGDIHYRLGLLALEKNERASAMAHFQSAVAIFPRYAAVQKSLGNEMLRIGRTNEAIVWYRAAIEVEPDDTETRVKLAELLGALGEAEGLEQYREVLRREPERPEILNNLAWILATHREERLRSPAEAVRLAERACELTGRKEAVILGTLAAAYAAAGRFDEAATTAELAVKVARENGAESVAVMNEVLAERYRKGLPYGP